MILPAPIPQFVDSSGRRIFTLYFPACAGGLSSVLLIPPFGEEMNKSRRMYSVLARQLSAHNQNVLLFDLFGTGDSDGFLEDVTWQDWIEDVHNCASLLWCKGAEKISLVALRTGALLAVDFLNSGSTNIHKLLLWQPVIDGRFFLKQFLRLRLAVSMMSGDQNRKTTKDLKAQLDDGVTLEISGYALTPTMAASFEVATLKSQNTLVNVSVGWLDLVSGIEIQSPIVNRKLVDQWLQDGVRVMHKKIVGVSFWSNTEIIENRELIDHTVSFLALDRAKR